MKTSPFWWVVKSGGGYLHHESERFVGFVQQQWAALTFVKRSRAARIADQCGGRVVRVKTRPR